ncbi:MAG: PQQ-dependent sugar dehydrogenase [Bacteroidota bacterium]
MRLSTILTLLLLWGGGQFTLMGQPVLDLAPFADGLTRPVDIAHAGDSRLFVVEQKGVIKIVDTTGAVNATAFLDIESKVNDNGNEQGLLGLTFHPNYSSNGYFYVYYTRSNASSRISRFTVDANDPNKADANSEKELLTFSQPFNNHNAGDLEFGPDGFLYITSGDGGSGGDPNDAGQRLNTFLGKILRIDVDNGDPYSIPADNPFVGVTNAKEEIWSLGWRNPWRFSFDRLTGDMWVGDVGQNEIEEISMEPADSTGGLNYGWRCLEGDEIFNSSGCGNVSEYILPVFAYDQSFSRGSSVTGGFVYRGPTYTALQGHYVFGDYNSGRFWTLGKDSQGTWTEIDQGTFNDMARDELSTFGEDVKGELYVAALADGKIFRVTEKTTPIDPGLGPKPLEIFPNPMLTESKVRFDNPSGQQYTLRVYDLRGRLVLEQADIREEEVILSREAFSKGLYLVKLEGPETFLGKLWIAE